MLNIENPAVREGDGVVGAEYVEVQVGRVFGGLVGLAAVPDPERTSWSLPDREGQPSPHPSRRQAFPRSYLTRRVIVPVVSCALVMVTSTSPLDPRAVLDNSRGAGDQHHRGLRRVVKDDVARATAANVVAVRKASLSHVTPGGSVNVMECSVFGGFEAVSGVTNGSQGPMVHMSVWSVQFRVPPPASSRTQAVSPPLLTV